MRAKMLPKVTQKCPKLSIWWNWYKKKHFSVTVGPIRIADKENDLRSFEGINLPFLHQKRIKAGRLLVGRKQQLTACLNQFLALSTFLGQVFHLMKLHTPQTIFKACKKCVVSFIHPKDSGDICLPKSLRSKILCNLPRFKCLTKPLLK